MKNVLILIVLFFVIRAIKKRFIDAPTLPREPKEAPKSPPKAGAGPARTDGEEMVLDPSCNSYVAVSSAIPANAGGRTEYFCSQECRDRFLSSK